jgi:N-acetylneuraminic acid mutarotase
MLKESAGIPWRSQCGFNPSTQNDITDWTSTNGLAFAVRDSASLVTKNYIYILGGNNGGSLDTIQRASFDANGALSSTWSNVGTLPVSMWGMGYIATKGRLYLIGGYNSSSGYLSSVYSAPINADGTLGAFRAEISLPEAKAYPVCFVIKDKLYVAAGCSNTVHRAIVNNDGTLSNWETIPKFPITFSDGEPLLIKDRIYIFGTYNNFTDTSEIYYATYDSDGNIGTWTYVSNMPNNLLVSEVVCTDNYVFCIAGYDINNNQHTNAVYRVPILADGSIGYWDQISNVPITVVSAQSVITGNKIYLIGGWRNGINLDTVYSASFTSGITDYTPFYAD